MINPFLKWAGGKRWLVRKHPKILNVEYNKYIEPFVGGGSVFFYMKPHEAILGDLNRELIEVYDCTLLYMSPSKRLGGPKNSVQVADSRFE